LCGILTRTADYYWINKKGQTTASSPPPAVVRDILSRPPAEWQFPPLQGIVEVPVLRPDGTILDTEGYDAATGLYYAPDPDLHVPTVPNMPTRRDVETAASMISSIIVDFPFVDRASSANAIGMILTPQLLPAINASTPMFLVDARSAGTGKTLFAETTSIVTTGRCAAMLSAPKDPDEWRKQITTILLDGGPVAVFDNISTRLDSAELCKAITERTHSDREMKTHNRMELPVICTWIGTGNNIEVGGDMARRCIWVTSPAPRVLPWRPVRGFFLSWSVRAVRSRSCSTDERSRPIPSLHGSAQSSSPTPPARRFSVSDARDL
jgi:hypothetical protein